MHKNSLLALLLATASWASVIDLRIDIDAQESPLSSLDNTHESASCYWDGTSPFCAGGCDTSEGYTACQTDSCGDGACCVTGYKKKCCKGSCSSSIDSGLSNAMSNKLELEASKHQIKTQDNDDNDICKDGQKLCCPAGASRNKECQCVDKKSSTHYRGFKVPRLLKNQQPLDDQPDNDICEAGETLCCAPGATGNNECECRDLTKGEL